VTERSKEPKLADLSGLVDKNINFNLKTAETPDERASRLRRSELESEHNLRSVALDEAHKRRLALMVHIFVMAVVAIGFLASVYIAVARDPKTNLPDKALGIIMAIVAALLGYLTGKGSK